MAVILCAGDNVQEQYSIWKLLKADGLVVVTAGNGAFALFASRNHTGPIDLLLADVEMPRIGGLELFRKIAAERPGIKVLLISDHLRESEQVSANGLPFLQKPFTFTTLRDNIEALLNPILTLK